MPDLAVTVPFSCPVVPRRDAVHVRPVGELDMGTVPELDARLAELQIAGFDQIVLDLRGLSFIDSRGVRMMLHWSRRATDEGFVFAVIGGGPGVQRVVELTGAGPHLTFVAPG